MKRTMCILNSLVDGVSNLLGHVRSHSCLGVPTIATSNLFRLHNVLTRFGVLFFPSFTLFPSKRWLALPLHPHNYIFSYNKTV